MPTNYSVPIKRDLCLRLGDQRLFVQVKRIGQRKVELQLNIPDECRIERFPVEGEEHLWPDGGVNCASEKHGYQIKSRKRMSR